VVCATAGIAHADFWNCETNVRGIDERHAVQLGVGATTGWRTTTDVIAGFHVTDRFQLRIRERGMHEAEAAYGMRLTGRPKWDTVVRAKLFAIAGAGIDDVGGYVWGGAMMRVHVLDIFAIEVGGRTTSITANEAFVSLSLFYEPLR